METLGKLLLLLLSVESGWEGKLELGLKPDAQPS